MLIDPLENRNAFRPDGPVKHHRNSMQVRTENETRRIEFQLPNKTSCYQSMPEKYWPHEQPMSHGCNNWALCGSHFALLWIHIYVQDFVLPISTIYFPGLENSHEQRAFPYHAKLECASKYREATNPKFWTVLQSRLWEGKILQLLRIYSRWCFGECTLSCRSLGECYHIPDWALTSQEHHQPIQSIGNASCSKISDTP